LGVVGELGDGTVHDAWPVPPMDTLRGSVPPAGRAPGFRL